MFIWSGCTSGLKRERDFMNPATAAAPHLSLEKFAFSNNAAVSRVAPDSDLAGYPTNIFPDTGYPANFN